MKHYLFYGCDNLYDRGPLILLKSIYVSDAGNEDTARNYESHFKTLFKQKAYSSLYILVLDLDPANGVTSITRNEYAENPLKKRIIINASAQPNIPKPNKKTPLLGYTENPLTDFIIND